MFTKNGRKIDKIRSCEIIRYVVFRRDFMKDTGWKICGYFRTEKAVSSPDLLTQTLAKLNDWIGSSLLFSYISLSPIIILAGAIV